MLNNVRQGFKGGIYPVNPAYPEIDGLKCYSSVLKVPDPVDLALREAEAAIAKVLTGSRPIELTPQNAYIRRLQHQLAEQHNVSSRSRGKEPKRRVKIFPNYDGK